MQSAQISTFLYCLGEEAEAVLTSTNATTDDCKDYEFTLEKAKTKIRQREAVRQQQRELKGAEPRSDVGPANQYPKTA